MGQYYKGEKIGTCENMYYMRLTQARKLADAGARDDDGVLFSDYLKDGVTRWRFPFVDEDGREDAGLLYTNVEDYNRGLLVAVPNTVELSHQDVTFSRSLGIGNVNIFVPCIHSKTFKDKELNTSRGHHMQYAHIKYKAMRYPLDEKTGERITDLPMIETSLIECAVCGMLQQMRESTLDAIRESAREDAHASCKLIAQRDLDNAKLVQSMQEKLARLLAEIERI